MDYLSNHRFPIPDKMATDYATLKVPDLKKLLQERGLHQSGNKADLIARLQDNDKSMPSFHPILRHSVT